MLISTRVDTWPLRSPFQIARGMMTSAQVVVVELDDEAGNRGRGEAAGVDYNGETPGSMLVQIENFRTRIEAGIERVELLTMLPAGGARNALDCALWDLEAKRARRPVWKAAGLSAMSPVVSAYTIGIGTLQEIATKAEAVRDHRLIKVKANAEQHIQAVEIVHRIASGAKLIVDANQSWTIELLRGLAPRLRQYNVALLEQPLPAVGDEALLAYRCPIPIAADESCTDRTSLADLQHKYQYVSIKLDKCGGLTEGLALAHEARWRGFGLMVGCMLGSSLSMAPAAVVAQLCHFVDLDGPLQQAGDHTPAIEYFGDTMMVPPRELWG